jgi:hypothetical protein
MVRCCLRLVLEGCVSLRAVPRVLGVLAEPLGLSGAQLPDWTTSRQWFLRLGLAQLRQPLEPAEDWIWLVDHSVQIGTVKCLVIVGLRARDQPPAAPHPDSRPLEAQDLRLIALEPMEQANKQTIHVELEKATQRTGIPRRIVSDHGADIKGAVDLFQQAHPATEDGYDVKHKLACLLKPRFEKDPRWATFASELGQCKFRLQQTPLAALTPPSQRSKSRYMNLLPLLKWGQRLLALLDLPLGDLPPEVDGAELQRRCGWLKEYRADLERWLGLHRTVGRTLKFLRVSGLTRGVWRRLARRLPAGDPFANEVVAFVREESKAIPQGERRPASTEILECQFSKLKSVEGVQSKNGFTRLVLSLGASVSSTTAAAVHAALTQTRTKDVAEWAMNHLGRSLQSIRDQCYKLADRKQKPSEKLASALE